MPTTREDIKYLSNPRRYDDPSEREFIREQAKYYYAALVDSAWHILVPACIRCCGDDLRYLYTTLVMECNDCGHRMSAIEPWEVGRLAHA